MKCVTDEIKFNNGKLKVMQVSDLQDTKRTCVDTLRFMDSAISYVKPDLIIMTGDQLDVVGMWGKGEKLSENISHAIKGLFSVFEKHSVPYVLTFGNHDPETGMPVSEQVKYYRELEHCICFDNINDGRPDAGTFSVPVLSSDAQRTALNFYLFDTHNTKVRGGFEGANSEQLEWYLRTSESLGKVPSLVFQHIPPDEIYELFTQVKKGTKGAQPAFRERRGNYYILNKNMIKFCEAYGEAPSTLTAESKEFETMRQQGDVFGIYFGHDHYNSFVGNVRGIDLGYCPGAGYNTYGLKNRAVRVFEFDEENVRDYKTYIVDYADCCKKSETAPIRNFLYCHSPSSTNLAKRFAAKCIAILLAVAAVFVLIGVLVSGTFVKMFLTSLAAGLCVYAVISLIFNSVLRKKLTGGK